MDLSQPKAHLLRTIEAIIRQASSDERQELKRAHKILEKLHIDTQQMEVVKVISDLYKFLHSYISKRNEPEGSRPRQRNSLCQTGISDKDDENLGCAEEVVEFADTLECILGPCNKEPEYQEVIRRRRKAKERAIEDAFSSDEDTNSIGDDEYVDDDTCERVT